MNNRDPTAAAGDTPGEVDDLTSPASPIETVEEFLGAVEVDCDEWETDQQPWFRGEPAEVEKPLLPTLFRDDHDENALLQYFRMRGPAALDLPNVPPRSEIDLWLFLARHMGLPTRLLDWTEGALIGLWFALQQEQKRSVVWMLNRLELNRRSLEMLDTPAESVANEPTLTWAEPMEGRGRNLFRYNIRAAWEVNTEAFPLPVGVQPTHIHGLMSAQHSCFTVHGSEQRGIHRLVGADCLRRYEIVMDAEQRRSGLEKLRRFGISRSVAFPGGRGLAQELAERF